MTQSASNFKIKTNEQYISQSYTSRREWSKI